jgi:small subunit ribosomal protein S17
MGFLPLSIQKNYLDTSSSSSSLRPFSSHPNIHERPLSSTVNNNNNNSDDDGGPVTSSTTTPTNLQHMSIRELADMSTIPGWSLIHKPPRKNPRGALVGRVVSDKMQKTVNVAVDRYKIIPKYRKRWRFTKKFMAHDEHEVCNMGDLVMIVPCQKISRHKHFMVREIIRPKGLL